MNREFSDFLASCQQRVQGALPERMQNIGSEFADIDASTRLHTLSEASLYSLLNGGKRVRAALDKVGLLDKEKLNPIMLSGGEQQRVGIARAVVNKPPLLLADEPTGNLDPELSAEIMQLFQDFKSVGVSVLIATHDIALINSISCPIMELSEGRLVRNEIEASRRNEADA